MQTDRNMRTRFLARTAALAGAVGLSGSALATAVTLPDLGVDADGLITAMGTTLGGYAGAAIGIALALVAIVAVIKFGRKACG